MSVRAERRAEDFLALAQGLEARFRAWDENPAPWSDDLFNSLALEVFSLQFDRNEPYGRYCRAVGATPDRVDNWQAIPPVPTAAFRTVDLVVGDPAAVQARFRTSGTSRGTAARGTHAVRRLDTYRAALTGPFRHAVLDGANSAFLVLLHPPFSSTGDSSLAWMFDALLARFGAAGSERVDPSGGLDLGALEAALVAAADQDGPAVVLGTTLALDDACRALSGRGFGTTLPPGSRVVDTGGAKGRAGLERSDLLRSFLPLVGLSAAQAVNEFGMTELLSQRYATGVPPLRLKGPPWLRTRVLDPSSLEELPEGEEGILCHYDLANVGSVVAVLTEDRGRAHREAIEWVGRTPGAPPRGCSLATAELLGAQA